MNLKKVIWMYSELIKWKQTLLLIFTAIFTYLISAVENVFVLSDLIFLFISLFFTISGTTILNMYIDHDIDKIMERTKDRPVPSGKIPLNVVLINGIIITAIGLILSLIFLDWLTTLVIFLGFFFDFVIYSIWLKRRTKLSILFGGIAGGLPSLAGRVLAIQKIDNIGIYFLIFILTWIPVHILTLALFPHNLKGYTEANVPMWPVVSSKVETMRVIAWSTLINAVMIFLIACFIQTNLVIRFIIGFVSAFLVLLVIEDMIAPTQKKTFRIFKFASMFMVLGYILLYIGVLI
jgi:heme o synthase